MDYWYDKKNGVFYKVQKGEVCFEDMIDSWNDIIGKNKIPDNTNKFILDYLQARHNISTDEIAKIIKFYRAYNHVFENAKIAFITNDPDQTTLPILINNEIASISFKPFSTKEAAINWLIRP